MSLADSSLNLVKVEKYLEQQDAENRSILANIIRNIRYITYEEFLSDLDIVINKLVKYLNSKNFHVLMPIKNGSEQWVYSLIQHIIESLPGFQGVVTEFTEDCQNLLLVDDFICTGNNICGTIDNFLYEKPHHIREIIIGVPYIGRSGIKNITQFLEYKKIETLVFAFAEQVPLFEPIQHLSRKKLSELKIDNLGICGFYTQWKVPGDCSGLPSILIQGIVPGKKNFGHLFHNLPVRIYS